MSERLPVLIVGAGPTGLMMACELARFNIPFRIIDKNPTRTEGSNATWLQTRTLEIFDALGIADRFLKIGHQCDAINFYEGGKKLVNIPLKEIDSIYPFILMLPQRETERLLTEYLAEFKCNVERSLELIDIRQTNDGVVSTVRVANGNTENITSDWVIACDGAHSTVRDKCQVSFLGKDFPEQFMVADAQMKSFLPKNEIHVFFDKGNILPDKGTLFSAFPWGSNKYRLSANLYLEHARQSFTEKEVKDVVAERTYGNYVVEAVSWISPFWIHSKAVDRMRQGSIFFAGDAADIHSPAGGQGMNSGLQDAYNLAWKLALVIQNKSNPSLLDTYQLERYPIVNEVVKQTEFFTNMMLFDKSFFGKLQQFSYKISNKSAEAKRIGTDLTQLGIQYKDSPIIEYQEIKLDSPQQGERAPDVIINKSKNLYDYMRNKLHNVLLFTGNAPTKNDLIKIKELQQAFNEDFPTFVKESVITSEKLDDVDKVIFDIDNVIFDTDGVIHRRYNIQVPCVYIIRPDNYIAYCSKTLDFASVENFLRQYLAR